MDLQTKRRRNKMRNSMRKRHLRKLSQDLGSWLVLPVMQIKQSNYAADQRVFTTSSCCFLLTMSLPVGQDQEAQEHDHKHEHTHDEKDHKHEHEHDEHEHGATISALAPYLLAVAIGIHSVIKHEKAVVKCVWVRCLKVSLSVSLRLLLRLSEFLSQSSSTNGQRV